MEDTTTSVHSPGGATPQFTAPEAEPPTTNAAPGEEASTKEDAPLAADPLTTVTTDLSTKDSPTPVAADLPTKDPPTQEELCISIKWNGSIYPITVYEGMTVADFKLSIQQETQVRPDKQKILNLKCKGKPATDDMLMTTLGLRHNMKVMMVGSVEEVLAAAAVPDELPEVVNDLDIPEASLGSIHRRQEYQDKITKHVHHYSLKLLHPMRPGKKLLVLDIDYTLFDHRSVGQNGLELMRPYLHEFLSSAYQDYDLAIWSATSMKWIQEKMRLLGVTGNPNYNIVFFVDSLAMIRVDAPSYGVVEVKPLGVIWGKHSHYTEHNTIMFDDMRRNFLMNPQNGLKIRAFRNAHENRATDEELLKLAAYLRDIAKLEDLSKLRHSRWESYRRGGY